MKPFLKWAGNKTRVLKHILPNLPEGKRLVEPFVGSGAVFLNAGFSKNLVSDMNADLINLYHQIKSDGGAFIEYAEQFFTPELNVDTEFYKIREQFNTTSDQRLKSALFIYLNRHCFNGLCRYNKKGLFNTPFGRYKRPVFPELEIRNFETQAQHTTFLHQDFRDTMKSALPGDVIYCDPPYVPLSATSNFTDYATGGFNLDDQRDLAQLALACRDRGITVLVSNHDTEFTREIYRDSNLVFFDVQRFISSDAANRNKASELLAIFS